MYGQKLQHMHSNESVLHFVRSADHLNLSSVCLEAGTRWRAYTYADTQKLGKKLEETNDNIT